MAPFLQPRPDPQPPGGKSPASRPMFRKPSTTASGALLVRLKSLRSRDLAFIAAGLSMFVMAPMAEHFISQSGVEEPMQAGFDQKGSFFGSGALFEEGAGGVAPGGLVGGESDLVTPLDVRHPADLITNEEGATPPAAPALAAPAESPAPRKPDEGGWKDAISEAAKRGVSKASERVKLPMPGAKLANKLNGISTFGGGGGHTSAAMPALSALSSKGLTSVPHTGTNLSRVEPVAGYRGSGKRGNTGTGGAFARQADGRLTGPGGSSGSGGGEGYLRNSQVTASGSGFGSRELDSPGAASGANSAKDDRNIGIKDRQNLAELRKKMELQEAIKLKWAKKQYDQIERKKMMEQAALQTASQAAIKVISKALQLNEDGSGSGSSGSGGPRPGQGGPEGSLGGTGSFSNMQALGDAFKNGSAANIASKDPSRIALGNAQKELGDRFIKESGKETTGKAKASDAEKNLKDLEQDQSRVEAATQKLETDNAALKTKVEGGEAKNRKDESYGRITPNPKDQTPVADEGRKFSKPAEDSLKEAKRKLDDMEYPKAEAGTVLGLARAAAEKYKAPLILKDAERLVFRGKDLHDKGVGSLTDAWKGGSKQYDAVTPKTDPVNAKLKAAQDIQDDLNLRAGKVW